MKHLNDKDVASGLMFTIIGLAGLVLAVGFDIGTAARPGPGFFPVLLAGLLVVIGLAVLAKGVRSPVEHYARIIWRPFFAITAAVASFALLIEGFGLIPAVLIAALIASFAKAGFGLRERLLTAAALAIFSAILFIGLLGLPIELLTY
ncbi:tripartite tricarboxylate transporter TctB family protein [Albirhodobacter sp. R86504]|uniref:tripartite tricarboxylate transporter TctB family protein n=1 Tax=Albirhodobacter sp. R86504 TaxID=3093848 RepID=UPI00366C1184